MKIQFARIAFAILLGLAVTSCPSSLLAGQARVVPLKTLIKESSLVAVVEVTKVTEVEVPTGEHQLSRVYVAEAQVQKTFKSDYEPIKPNRKIAVVGSTIPRSTAVWQPIEKGRYLAFLQHEQGHYRYGMLYAFRKIDANESVPWYEIGKDRTKIFRLDLDEALDRIKKVIQ